MTILIRIIRDIRVIRVVMNSKMGYPKGIVTQEVTRAIRAIRAIRVIRVTPLRRRAGEYGTERPGRYYCARNELMILDLWVNVNVVGT